MAKKICLGCMEEYEDNLTVCPYCGYVEGTKAVEAYHLQPGVVLQGKYIVGKAIGYGGFGVTYIGYDFALNHKIAIKEYLPGECSTRCEGDTNVTVFEGKKSEQYNRGIEKFTDEARRLADLRNIKNIVTIFDCFMENNTAYIVMEYLEGRTIKEIIAQEGKMSYEKAVGYIAPVLDALEAVHKTGLIHRDISPDNILVTNDGRVKLIDFGAARYASTESNSLSIIVKAGYAPPEQYRSNGKQGGWTDVYACAATLYTMLTGEVPEESMNRIQNDNLIPPRKKGSDIPKKKQNALKNALNLKVEDRTQTAAEFKKDLISDASVTRKKDTLKGLDIGEWPLWIRISLGVTMLAIVTFIVLLSTGVIDFSKEVSDTSGLLAEGEVIVPNVVNMEYSKAKTRLEDAGLKIKISGKVNSSDIPKNYILSQNITGGTRAEKDTEIMVTMSAGGDTIYMEDIIGFKLEDVTNKLDTEGILYFSPDENENEIAPGYICYQGVGEGKTVEKGTQIKLTVSKGKSGYDFSKKTKVPNLVGKSFEDGRKAVKEAHLYICKTGAEYSDTLEKGQIISQEIVDFDKPDKNTTEINEGCIIGVKVSLGIRKIRIPDLEFMKKDDAVKKLEELGLKVNVAEEDSETVEKGLVIRQSIAAEEEIEVSKDGKIVEVTIFVSRGITGLVPNVVGMSKTLAEDSIKASGFTVGNVTFKETDSENDDAKVVSQNPAAETKADSGSKVDLVVYKYEKKTTEEKTTEVTTTEEKTTEAQVVDHSWSEWQEQEIKGTDTIEVETKTQYSYREYTMKTEYGDWSDWSFWKTDADVFFDPAKADQYDPNVLEYEVEEEYEIGIFRIIINGHYYTYESLNYDMVSSMSGNGESNDVIQLAIDFIDNGRAGEIYEFVAEVQNMGYSASVDSGVLTTDYSLEEGSIAYDDYGTPGVVVYVTKLYAQYRYRMRAFSQTVSYGAWTAYSDDYVADADGIEVRTRQMYRWRNR